MRIVILWMILSLVLNAIALEVILDPYADIDYGKISVYDLSGCDCSCYQDNYLDQL